MHTDTLNGLFDELTKIAVSAEGVSRLSQLKAHPFYTGKRGAAVGAAALGGHKLTSEVERELKERAKDSQRGVSPEEQKKNKRRRMAGAAVGAGLSTATGAGAGFALGKANEWGRSKVTDEAVKSTVHNKVRAALEGLHSGVEAAPQVRNWVKKVVFKKK